jgi:hypothetical protein
MTYVTNRLTTLDEKVVKKTLTQQESCERLGLMGCKTRGEISVKEFYLLSKSDKEDYIEEILSTEQSEWSGAMDYIIRFFGPKFDTNKKFYQL